MKIKVEHEVPYDPENENCCIYAGGDFEGKEVCRCYTHRDRTHGRKAPNESCFFCKDYTPGLVAKSTCCSGYKWRGEQKGEEDE